jgi:hypothetical protein
MKKIFLKVFLICCVPFTILAAISFSHVNGIFGAIYYYLKDHDLVCLNYIVKELPILLKFSIISGILSGFLMTVFYVGSHYFSLKKLGCKDIYNYDNTQIREIELQYPYVEAFNVCKQSLNIINSEVISENIESGSIKAKTKNSKKSFGEEIEFNLIKINDSLTKIIVTSKPPDSYPSTHLDYGKNFKNAENIIKYLKNHFETNAGQPHQKICEA